MFNNSFAMAMGTNNAAYGMFRGELPGGPGATNSMIPLTKLQGVPDLPPRKDLYMTPRNILAPPNAYERHDSYTRMNPSASSAFVPETPPPQYEASKKDQLYAEIPGEYLTIMQEEEDDQYGNVSSSKTKLQLNPGDTAEKDDISVDSEKPETDTVQEVYGNL